MTRLYTLTLLFTLATPALAVDAPPPRAKSDVHSILSKAPARPDGELRHLNILLVAGPKDHGPGEHDYPAWQTAWAPLMAKAKNVKIDTAWKWPTKEQLDAAHVMVCYFKSPWTAEQIEDVKKLQSRGGGLVIIHWAISPDKEFEKHQTIVGITYRGASFRHGPTTLKVAAPDHPIVLGMPKEMKFVDEPYWPFIGEERRVKVLATSDEMIHRGDDRAKNPGDTTTKTIPVFWTFEPEHKGRAFVSIFGHYMWTFDDPLFRLLLLRGIAWSANEWPYRFDELATEGVKLAE
jgi:type 1 glutamine amidotransferase